MRSGRFPTGKQYPALRSSPTSSRVSRVPVAQSLSSVGSRFPPGRATWLVHRSPVLAARLMKSTSGSACCTQARSKNSFKRSSNDVDGVLSGSLLSGQYEGSGRKRITKATEALFLQSGGLATSGYGCSCRWCSTSLKSSLFSVDVPAASARICSVCTCSETASGTLGSRLIDTQAGLNMYSE